MEALFTSLELTISSVQEVSMLIGGILLLIAFVVYMIRSETPKDYLEGIKHPAKVENVEEVEQ